jgi:hypothetical protein
LVVASRSDERILGIEKSGKIILEVFLELDLAVLLVIRGIEINQGSIKQEKLIMYKNM